MSVLAELKFLDFSPPTPKMAIGQKLRLCGKPVVKNVDHTQLSFKYAKASVIG